MLEVLFREIRSGCLEELLCADDLGLVSENLEGLKGRLEGQKGALESRGSRVNVQKTKMVIRNENSGKVTMECKFAFAVAEKLQALVPSCTSFVGVLCIREVVVLGKLRIVSLNVGHVQINKQT